MENNKDKRHEDDKGKSMNFTNDNKELKKGTDQHNKPDGLLPEDDPALINPDELASFPKEMKNEDPDIDEERDSHLTNRRSSPVRDGRNITRTDTTPDNDGGFM
jgi:hypothetical protein